MFICPAFISHHKISAWIKMATSVVQPLDTFIWRTRVAQVKMVAAVGRHRAPLEDSRGDLLFYPRVFIVGVLMGRAPDYEKERKKDSAGRTIRVGSS